jgi:hypothetical protein
MVEILLIACNANDGLRGTLSLYLNNLFLYTQLQYFQY